MTTGETLDPGPEPVDDPLIGVDPSWASPVPKANHSESVDLASEAAKTTELTDVLASYFEMGYFESGYVEHSERTTTVRPGEFESASELAKRDPAATRFELVPRRRARLVDLIHRLEARMRSLGGLFAGVAAAMVLLAGIAYVVQRQAQLSDPPAAENATSTSTATPGNVVVPVVADIDELAATNRLRNVGLEVGVTRAFDNGVAPKLVISSDPASGEAVEIGSTVGLMVSRGTEPICSGAAEDQVRQRLANRDLSVGSVSRTPSETIEADLVVRCEFSENTDTVILVVSDGPEPDDEE